MGIFDIFSKKEKKPDYDVTNLSVKDLRQGFILDYDMKSWVVKEEYEYDWGNSNFSKEYMLDSGDEVVYLGVEDKGENFLTVMKPVKVRKLGEHVSDEVIKNESPPKSLVYENETYHLESDSAGYFHDITKGTDDWEELMSWELLTDDGTKIVSITQWDEKSVDAFAGVVVKDFEISNIIPAE